MFNFSACPIDHATFAYTIGIELGEIHTPTPFLFLPPLSPSPRCTRRSLLGSHIRSPPSFPLAPGSHIARSLLALMPLSSSLVFRNPFLSSSYVECVFSPPLAMQRRAPLIRRLAFSKDDVFQMLNSSNNQTAGTFCVILGIFGEFHTAVLTSRPTKATTTRGWFFPSLPLLLLGTWLFLAARHYHSCPAFLSVPSFHIPLPSPSSSSFPFSLPLFQSKRRKNERKDDDYKKILSPRDCASPPFLPSSAFGGD